MTNQAAFHERAKRTAWLFGALILTGALLITASLIVRGLGYPMEAVPVVVSVLLLDYHIWSWGVKRFDITPPKEFREATEVSESDA